MVFISYSCKNETTTTQDGTLHIAKKRDPQKLNPFVFPSPTSRDVYQYIFPQLADFDPISLKLSPVLIKQIPEEVKITEGTYSGGLKFTIEILPEAKWDDGTDVTGHDLSFSIKAIKTPLVQAAGYRTQLQYLSDVVVYESNAKKVDLIFSEDYMLAQETAATLEIYPAHIYDPMGLLKNLTVASIHNGYFDSDEGRKRMESDTTLKSWAEDFSGIKYCRDVVSNCGPYMLKEWVTDQYVVLQRKENYWGKNSKSPFLQAGPKTIIFDIIPDETAVITQLNEGNIDVATEVSGTAFEDLKSKDLQLFSIQLMRYYMLTLNNDRPELADKTVRNAIAHLVDVDNIIKNIEYGSGTRTIGPIHPSKSYYNNTIEPIPYDIEKSKELLTSAGWEDTNKDGTIDKVIDNKKVEFDLDMFVSEGKLGQQIALLLQESAAKVGIKVNIIQKPYRQIAEENIKTRDYDMTPVVISQDLVLDDPYSRWHSDQDYPGGRNQLGYNSDEVDRITKEIQITNDPEVREKLYKEVQEILYEDQPAVFLYAPSERIAISSKWNATTTVRRPGYLANTFTLKE